MLADFQSRLANAIRSADAAVPPGLCADNGRQMAGLRVYRNNSAHARAAALKDAYPVVHRLIGYDCMSALALDMMAQRPVANADARGWTAQLPDFIASTHLAAQLPYLADVAALERAWLIAYHGPDPEPMDPPLPADPDELATARLHLAPAVSICRSAHPAHAIWTAQRNGERFQGGGARNCIIYRNQMDVVAEPLAEHTADLLGILDATPRALDWFERMDGDTDAQQCAGRLLAAGAIVHEQGE